MSTRSGDERARRFRALIGLGADLDTPAVRRRVVEAVLGNAGAAFAMLRPPGGTVRNLDLDVLREADTGGDFPGIDRFVPLREGVLPEPAAGQRRVAVPIVHGRERLGLLYAGYGEPGVTEEQLDHLREVVEAAAGALANARVHELAEQRRRWLEGAVATAEHLGRALSVGEADAGAVESASSMTGAATVALLRSGIDGPVVTALVGDREYAEQLVDLWEGVIAGAVADGRFVIVDQPRGAPSLVIPVKPAVAPPVVLLIDHGGHWGKLTGFEPDVLHTLIDQLALFFDRMYLTQERERILVSTDRERIARDLHDVVIQRIFATGLGLQGVRRLVETAGGDGTAAMVDHAISELDLAMKDLRATVHELQRQNGLSIVTEVEGLLDDYELLLGFRPRLRTVGTVDSSMGGLIRDHLLAAARELLSNVAKHARATAAEVELEADRDRAVLRVSDDGVGLEQAAGPADLGGNGLRNLRDRAHDLAGEVVVSANRPRGTVVTWSVPTTRDRL